VGSESITNHQSPNQIHPIDNRKSPNSQSFDNQSFGNVEIEPPSDNPGMANPSPHGRKPPMFDWWRTAPSWVRLYIMLIIGLLILGRYLLDLMRQLFG